MSRPAVATGEVWLANLDPTVGSEIQTARPCVVVSPPEMHDYQRTVIVAPHDHRLAACGLSDWFDFSG